ncbi:ACP phosphodiesterase [Vibrio sp. Isolate23]|uniref:acyl carrier protein phosphodiesterase n=1 Tax=Vibrio sp. Isolate23 TaxID=2908533 RepID=UPI001EFC9A09|nr:ACP phosphodiesterase [Vibrio sp. Isolate23]MCG9681065.1 ACP phosphodiesterase [Vibrio sp. Isolate23]
MNYLAHLHIAQHCQSSLLGNLLGDFVKGNPAHWYSPRIVQGIKLHRFVDSTTDSHALMRQARQYFGGKSRRFSGIALDMFWDHCLASEWPRYHKHRLKDFCDDAERVVRIESPEVLPERFVIVSQAMWQGRWLESYQELENIEYALQRMSTRSPRMGELSRCFATLEQRYQPLKEIFHCLYPEILNAAKRF